MKRKKNHAERKDKPKPHPLLVDWQGGDSDGTLAEVREDVTRQSKVPWISRDAMNKWIDRQRKS